VTRQIGTALVDAIEEINLSSTVETDEIDLVNKNNNIVLSGADEAENIEISFTLVDGRIDDIESLESDIRDLVSNPAKDNYFEFNDLEGRLSVENVSLPESSEARNLRNGTIDGKYLPYPKHFSEEDGFFLLPKSKNNGVFKQEGILSIISSLLGDVEGSLSSDGNIVFIENLDGNIDSNININGSVFILSLLSGDINSSLNLQSELIYLNPLSGELSSIFTSQGNISLIISLSSSIEGSLDKNARLSNNISINGILNSTMDISAELTVSEYGSNYGSNYGS